jgi:glucosamine-6-phosphate deaminase
MDEYIGVPESAPQCFRRYLEDHIINLVNPGKVRFLGDAPSINEECQRYGNLLIEHPVDIVCCGIGENGHLAFNDPRWQISWIRRSPRLWNYRRNVSNSR